MSTMTGSADLPRIRLAQDNRFQLRHASRVDRGVGIPSDRWTSPLEVAVSVDTGLNSSQHHGRERPSTTPSIDLHQSRSQGILALAIPPVSTVSSLSASRTMPPTPGSPSNATTHRGMRHVTFGATTTTSSSSSELVKDSPIPETLSNSNLTSKPYSDRRWKQRRFARSFSNTPDLDSTTSLAAPGQDSDEENGQQAAYLLPPKSFRDDNSSLANDTRAGQVLQRHPHGSSHFSQPILSGQMFGPRPSTSSYFRSRSSSALVPSNNLEVKQKQKQRPREAPPAPPAKGLVKLSNQNYQRAPLSSSIVRDDRDHVADDKDDDEHFVDGKYFFDQLDERAKKANEDDARRREWRRRNIHHHRELERLSTSLPVDYFQVTQRPRIHERNMGDDVERRFASGMELEIPLRWPTTIGHGEGGRLRESTSADHLLQRPVRLRQNAITKDYCYYSQQHLQVRPLVVTDISATEGRYHVGTGHRSDVHQFRPIVGTPPSPSTTTTTFNYGHRPPAHSLSGQLSRLDTTTTPPHSTRSERTLDHDDDDNNRLSASLDPARFGRRIIDDEEEEECLRRLHLASAIELDRTRHSDEISLAVNRDESLGSAADHPKSSPTGRTKAVSWRDQEPNQPALEESVDLRRNDYDDVETTAEGVDSLRTPLQAVSPQSYPDSSLSRSLQGSASQMENIDQFALFEVSTSFLGWGESFMGTSWIDTIKQYKFVVLNRYEEVLFFGIEEDSSLSNCTLGPHKSSFKVRILDANGRDVIQFRRLYPFKTTAKLSLGTKRKYRLEVSTSSGRVIGNVEKTFDSDSYYVLEDRAGECLFVVQRSCICTCPLFWDYEFKVLIPGTDTEVGDISWSYLTAHEEHFNGTEISFPVELEATSKIMLLGVCFLLNFSRWQSSYLDSVYNPKKRGTRAPNATTNPSATPKVVHNSTSSHPMTRNIRDDGNLSADSRQLSVQ